MHYSAYFMAMHICFKADTSICHVTKKNVYKTANTLVNIPWIHRTDDQFHADILLLISVSPAHIPDIPRERQMSVPTPRDKPATNKWHRLTTPLAQQTSARKLIRNVDSLKEPKGRLTPAAV